MPSLARLKFAAAAVAVAAAVGTPFGLAATAAQAAPTVHAQAGPAGPGQAGPNGSVPTAWTQQWSATVHPDMAGPNGTHPVAHVEKRGGGIRPNSASGCNQSVCINVVGSGLYVSDWSTTAYPSTYVCSYAAYWANGSVIATSNEVCGNQNDVFYSDWKNPGYFANNTQVCNTWLQIAGRPCETVHS